MLGNPIAAAIASPLPTKRGRPRRNDPVGPTPQTVAKLQSDIVAVLIKAGILTEQHAITGREILDAWEMIVAPVATASSRYGGIAGRNDIEGSRVERLQRTWRLWADGMPAKTHVRYDVVLGWLLGDRVCDTRENIAAGVLRKALEWWEDAAAIPPASAVQGPHDAAA